MKKHNIVKYEITSDGVDVHQDVKLYEGNLPELPFQFNEVHGSFACRDNGLQSLRGSPRLVHADFNCSSNKLTSLEHAPKVVHGNFYCYDNQIPTWEHRYLLFSEIQGMILTNNYPLDLWFRRYQNQKSLIPEALKELRKL